MFTNNINNKSYIVLIVLTLTVFFKNFYNEILQNYLNNPNFFQTFFSDFYLIYAGAEILSKNINPYEEWIKLHNSPFFNPPLVFNFFKFLANYNYLIVAKYWLIILILTFFLIPIIIFKIFKIHPKYCYIFLLSFGGISLNVFFTGNLSIVLNLLFALSIFFLSRKEYHYFYLILSALCLIKFPYLIFFGIPFLIKNLEKKLFINTFFYLLLITLIYLLSFYSNPEIFNSWINSLKFSENIGDSGDFGRGLFRIIDNNFFSEIYLNNFIYIIISGFLFLFLIFLFKNSKILNNEKNKNLAIAFSIIFLTMLLPRLKSYDVLITIPCLFFIIENLEFKISQSLNLVFKFILFLALFCWTSPYAPICLYLILFFILSSDLKYNFIEKK